MTECSLSDLKQKHTCWFARWIFVDEVLCGGIIGCCLRKVVTVEKKEGVKQKNIHVVFRIMLGYLRNSQGKAMQGEFIYIKHISYTVVIQSALHKRK